VRRRVGGIPQQTDSVVAVNVGRYIIEVDY
jgi:hypothetical protein